MSYASDWEKGRWETFTEVSVAGTLPSMGRSEVVEYTDEFDGGDSSSIEHVYYNDNDGRLTIVFKRTGTYSYDGVSRETYIDFENADSLGQFFHSVFQVKGDVWTGAKHNDRTVRFEKIEREEEEIEPDLDALKPEAITVGRGPKFKLHFKYASKGEMVVRAEDMDKAIANFKEYMAEHGFTNVQVTAVTIDLT